ncbi:MAG TPA: Stp1/IreP family PP2C-type Ser/Thr phosphatase [Chitinophagaceae bacterium]|nr:Stp1/IreP family PP2C-type Ser/Thr phosphatase [Chitinophagaceae bacterium]
MKIKLAAATDIGMARDHNEDSFAIFTGFKGRGDIQSAGEYILDEHGAMLIVADGMGGTNAGEVASALAISSVKEYLGKIPEGWGSSSELLQNVLVGAIKFAHRKILKYGRNHPGSSGMGTTIVLAYINNATMHVAWAGDSRCYVLRKDEVELVTHDHSVVQEMIDDGEISIEESFYHPERNFITKCLGGSEPGIVDPEIREFKLEAGDRILLCSDGLNSIVFDHRIGEIISGHDDLAQCAAALINEANTAGGYDNITVVLAEIGF